MPSKKQRRAEVRRDVAREFRPSPSVAERREPADIEIKTTPKLRQIAESDRVKIVNPRGLHGAL